MQSVLNILQMAFNACVDWTIQLFARLDASWVVLSAFTLVLVVGLLLIPLRGNNVTVDAFTDFTVGRVHKSNKKKSTALSVRRESDVRVR